MICTAQNIRHLVIFIFPSWIIINLCWLRNEFRFSNLQTSVDVLYSQAAADFVTPLHYPLYNESKKYEIETMKTIKTTPLIIAGAQKGGTTALWQYLQRHPQVQRNGGPRVSEMNYFNRGEGPKRRSFPNGTIYPEDVPAILEDYQSYWNVTDPSIRVTFEKTPIYMFSPKAVSGIRSVVPHAKIIMLLRNPVDRAFSHYKMSRRRQKFVNKYGPITFEDCIQKDIDMLNAAGVKGDVDIDWDELDEAWRKYLSFPTSDRCDSVVGRGLYVLQLRIWWAHYGQEEIRQQFLIMESEKFRPDSSSGMIDMNPITAFLGISQMNVNGSKVIHATKDSKMAHTTREMLESYFGHFNGELKALLGEGWDNPW